MPAPAMSSQWPWYRWLLVIGLPVAGVPVTLDAWSDIVKIARVDEEASHIKIIAAEVP